ncbi:MAG: S-methyl-5-thioribose-1-phosphate isomerase [Candidatus Micrarchaeota archaeon]|nr:S-methyl-5-thioribose-1-phosphate isomerase [Candidatus Micrarchaeota archaeon]
MHKKIENYIKKIKSLEIQGARKIAKAALKCFEIQVKTSEAKKSEELYAELIELADLLAEARPTEPMLRNTLRQVLATFDSKLDINRSKENFLKNINEFFKLNEQNLQKIAHFGSQLIGDEFVVLTHCHSNTVIAILKNAYDIGKKFKVICTETRPRGQGYITAKELSEHGIDVTLIVDSAISMYAKKVDIAIVGADAITVTGDLINKIGTRLVAEISKAYSIPFYSAAELYKYDPITRYGVMENIEYRSIKEIIGNKKVKYKVENPAFDVTPNEYIKGYITEKGLISPQVLMLATNNFLVENPF